MAFFNVDSLSTFFKTTAISSFLFWKKEERSFFHDDSLSTFFKKTRWPLQFGMEKWLVFFQWRLAFNFLLNHGNLFFSFPTKRRKGKVACVFQWWLAFNFLHDNGDCFRSFPKKKGGMERWLCVFSTTTRFQLSFFSFPKKRRTRKVACAFLMTTRFQLSLKS